MKWRARSAGRRRLAGILFAGLCAAAGPAAAGGGNAAPVPDGYRMSDYRAPVPDRLPGGTAIDTAGAADLLASGAAVFIDVMPTPPRPPGRDLWNPPRRASLPGTHWLPNVGRGVLPAATEAYYRRHLRRLTGGRKDRPLVIFCERDCWMSWNAAKRALAYEYTEVYWYPGGTTAWREAGRQMARLAPVGEIPP